MDIAKGIGIICVILGHMGIDDVGSIIYSFHMPMFFLISGYFMKEYSLREVFQKRSRRLLPPYFLTCIMVIVLDTLKNLISVLLHKKTGNYLICKVFYWLYAMVYGAGTEHIEPFRIVPIGAVWFLLALLWASCIVCFAEKRKYSEIIILGFALVGFYSSKIIWLPWSVQAGMTSALFMFVGLQLKRSEFFEIARSKVQNCTLFVACLVIWINEMCIENFDLSIARNSFPNGFFDVIGSVCGSICMILISGAIARVQVFHVLSWFGKNSLIILCVHLVELNVIPWNQIANLIFRVKEPIILYVLLMKFFWCTLVTILVLKLKVLYTCGKRKR